MGYYSDVAIAIKKEDKDVFLAAMKKFDLVHEKEGTDEYGRRLSAQNIYDWAEVYEDVENSKGQHFFVMKWEYVKWNTWDYAFKFFDNPPVLYDYLRVGEEAGDIEERGDLKSGVIGVYSEQHVEIYE